MWYGGTSRRGTITGEQFAWERQSAGLTREGAADLLGVGLRTIGTWETGEASPSYSAFKLLRVFRQGEFIDPAWSGYRLVRGVLVTPEGREVRPADMGWIGLLLGRARLAREIARERDSLRARLSELSQRAEQLEARGPRYAAAVPPLAHHWEGGVAFTLSIPAYGTESALGRGATSSTAITRRTDASIALGRVQSASGDGGLSLTLPERPEFPSFQLSQPQPSAGGVG